MEEKNCKGAAGLWGDGGFLGVEAMWVERLMRSSENGHLLEERRL